MQKIEGIIKNKYSIKDYLVQIYSKELNKNIEVRAEVSGKVLYRKIVLYIGKKVYLIDKEGKYYIV